MISLKSLIIHLVLALTVNGYDTRQLDCEVIHKQGKKICVVLELSSFTKFTRVEELPEELMEIPFTGLYLMSSFLFYLPDQLFKHFPNITELKIITDTPQLMYIETRDLLGLEQLKNVYITGQMLRVLEASVFQGAPAITHLFLSANRIETVNERAFEGLHKCLFLVLSSNRISNMKSGTFKYLPNLWHVGLENNRIISIAEDFFENISPAVCDASFNLLNSAPLQPVEKILKSEHKRVSFSFRRNLCSSMKDTVITKRRSSPKIENIIADCKLSPACDLKAEEQIESSIIGKLDENVTDIDSKDDPNETIIVELMKENEMLKDSCGKKSDLNADEYKMLQEQNQEITNLIEQIEVFMKENGFSNLIYPSNNTVNAAIEDENFTEADASVGDVSAGVNAEIADENFTEAMKTETNASVDNVVNDVNTTSESAASEDENFTEAMTEANEHFTEAEDPVGDIVNDVKTKDVEYWGNDYHHIFQ